MQTTNQKQLSFFQHCELPPQQGMLAGRSPVSGGSKRHKRKRAGGLDQQLTLSKRWFKFKHKPKDSGQEHLTERWEFLHSLTSRFLHVHEGMASAQEDCVEAEDSEEKRPPYQLTQEDLMLVAKLVKTHCRKFRVTEIEDQEHEIICALLRKDYLGAFDPAKGSKSSYLNRFIYNHFCDEYKRKKREKQVFINLHTEDMEFGLADTTPLFEPCLLREMEAIAVQLRAEQCPMSGVLFAVDWQVYQIGLVQRLSWPEAEEGEYILWRSYANVWRLLCLGFQQIEIAQLLSLSKGRLSHWVDDIRGYPYVQEFQKYLLERALRDGGRL